MKLLHSDWSVGFRAITRVFNLLVDDGQIWSGSAFTEVQVKFEEEQSIHFRQATNVMAALYRTYKTNTVFICTYYLASPQVTAVITKAYNPWVSRQ